MLPKGDQKFGRKLPFTGQNTQNCPKLTGVNFLFSCLVTVLLRNRSKLNRIFLRKSVYFSTSLKKFYILFGDERFPRFSGPLVYGSEFESLDLEREERRPKGLGTGKEKIGKFLEPP